MSTTRFRELFRAGGFGIAPKSTQVRVKRLLDTIVLSIYKPSNAHFYPSTKLLSCSVQQGRQDTAPIWVPIHFDSFFDWSVQYFSSWWRCRFTRSLELEKGISDLVDQTIGLKTTTMDFIRTLILVIAAVMLSPAAAARYSHTRRFDVPAIFAFGDSLADVGTNNFLPQATARADFPPYGKTFFDKPTGRFTDGRNIVDFIAQALELPFAPPFLQPHASFTNGANFASSGSGLLDSTNAGEVNPMSVQVQQFASVKATLQQRLGKQRAAKLISKSIFLILSGSNDLSSFLENPELQNQMTPAQFITSVVEAYKQTLLALYSSGARKVVVFGAGPVGCSPLARASNPTNPGECVEAANQLAVAFNAGLKQLVDGLRGSLPGLNLVLANSFDTVTAIIANGKAFGLDNVNAACCGAGFLNAQVQCGKPVPANLPNAVADFCKRPSKSLFWDLLHPSEAAVRILFKLLFTGDVTVAYPINLKALAGL